MAYPNDDDVILWLLPHVGKGFEGAVEAISLPENQSRRIAAPHDVSTPSHVLREEQGETERPTTTDCLAVRFSDGCKTSVGVVCGCAASVDLAFPATLGSSKYHLAITFDDENKPIVRDLGSKHGTKVTYDGEQAEPLSNFVWSLEGPSIAKGKAPVLTVTNDLEFKVVVPSRDHASPEHVKRVKEFRAGIGDPGNLLSSLGLESFHNTRLHTGIQPASIGSHPKFFMEVLGEGTFGAAIYHWNVTTREEYVVKQPRPIHLKYRTFDETAWKKEAKMMSEISHDHIVAFRGATFTPYPQLKFEYVPGGTLESYTEWSALECTEVLHQLSSALAYLHSKDRLICHRDIKPENTLVKSKGPEGILVKFADFGLSKAAEVLRSVCGTRLWAAPPLLRNWEGGQEIEYSVDVDIWSLGVVVASLKCGPPTWMANPNAYIREVQRHVSNWGFEHGGEPFKKLFKLIVNKMLVEDSTLRSTAAQVRDEAEAILEGMGVPTPTTKSVGSEAVAVVEENRESATALGSVEAQTEERLEKAGDESFIARGLLGDEGAQEAVQGTSGTTSKRKRSLPEEQSQLSPPHPFTFPSSAEQQSAESKSAPAHKRSRVSKEL